jgi:hypothetical protein
LEELFRELQMIGLVRADDNIWENVEQRRDKVRVEATAVHPISFAVIALLDCK